MITHSLFKEKKHYIQEYLKKDALLSNYYEYKTIILRNRFRSLFCDVQTNFGHVYLMNELIN